MSILSKFTRGAAAVAALTAAGQAAAQLPSETRQYLNNYCLEEPITWWGDRSVYYQRLGTDRRFRTIDFSIADEASVQLTSTAIQFNCSSNCRYTMDYLGGPGRIYTTVAILSLKAGASSYTRQQCVRAIRHMIRERRRLDTPAPSRDAPAFPG